MEEGYANRWHGIHRTFAEVVALDGATHQALGKISLTRDQLKAFATTLDRTDHVIVEATGTRHRPLSFFRPTWLASLSPILCRCT